MKGMIFYLYIKKLNYVFFISLPKWKRNVENGTYNNRNKSKKPKSVLGNFLTDLLEWVTLNFLFIILEVVKNLLYY